MPQAARLELHHADVDRRRQRVPLRRNPAGHRHPLARDQQRLLRIPRLQHGQHADPLFQFLHQRQLSHQFRHLLRHVSPVQRNVQGSVH